MTYEIKKGVPMPESTGRGRARKYPFHRMEPGDCFDVPPDDCRRAQSAASYFARKHGRKMVTCALPDGGRRIWRLS